jgi:hypothetical protein
MIVGWYLSRPRTGGRTWLLRAGSPGVDFSDMHLPEADTRGSVSGRSIREGSIPPGAPGTSSLTRGPEVEPDDRVGHGEDRPDVLLEHDQRPAARGCPVHRSFEEIAGSEGLR